MIDIQGQHHTGMGIFIRNTMWDNNKDPSENIRKIVKSFNIGLEFTEHYPSIITKPVGQIIRLSCWSSPFRTNWNIAHMLGHVFYQNVELLFKHEFSCRNKDSEIEIEAEDFAFDLMLPDKEVVEYYHEKVGKTTNILNLLGGRFLVPREKIIQKLNIVLSKKEG